MNGVTYKNNMIFPGGSTRSLIAYDTEQEELVRIDVPYHNMRIGASSVVIEDTLYLIGGRDYNENYTEIADQNYKSVISLSLKDLQFPTRQKHLVTKIQNQPHRLKMMQTMKTAMPFSSSPWSMAYRKSMTFQ
ncbi:hypothetical protein BSAF29S_04328 [Bacillus safensis subsp. safensis]